MSPDAPLSSSPAQTEEPSSDETPQVPSPADSVPETPESEIPTVEIPPPAAAPTDPVVETPIETPAKSADVATPDAGTEAPEQAEDEKTFDPATDLPMYREGMDWFVLRVASNKENYVKDTLLRKVQIEGLVDRVGRIMVPTEKTKTL